MTDNPNIPEPAVSVEAVEAPPPKMRNRRKTLAITAGVSAAALVAVAGFAVPQIVHAAQVAEYQALTAETQQLYVQAAENTVTEQATLALTEYHLVAAHGLADALTVWGSKGPVIVSADAAAALTEAGTLLAEKLAATAPAEDSDAEAVPVLREAHQARMAADKEAAAAEADADDAVTPASAQTTTEPVPVLPLALTVAHAAELLELSEQPAKVDVVTDAEVTSAEVASAREARDTAAKQAAASEAKSAEAADAHQQVTDLVEGSREALTLAASEAPAQAARVVADAPHASTDWHSKVTSMAEAAAKVAEDKQASIAELTGAVQGYVDAASGALAQHAELAAEAAAIAAAQSGSGGYTDPTTGQWREVPSHVWFNYGGGGSGGWSGGGSSWSGGGDSGGSGGEDHSAAFALLAWLEANCRWGYNWSSGSGGHGYCYPAPYDEDDMGW